MYCIVLYAYEGAYAFVDMHNAIIDGATMLVIECNPCAWQSWLHYEPTEEIQDYLLTRRIGQGVVCD